MSVDYYDTDHHSFDVDDTPGDSYMWREQHLYGSSRLGMVEPKWKAPLNPAYNPTSDPVDNGIVGSVSMSSPII